METIIILVAVMVVLELFEAYMQYANTLYGVMEKLNYWYQKSIFAFFLVHPSFYYVLFIIVMTKILNIYMILILVFKIFDLFYKIELIKTIFIKKNISSDLQALLEWKIPPWFFFFGVALYPPLLFYALTY
jgi:hypothetical protein